MSPETQENELRERPIGELMRQLAEESATLVRQEVQLAKAEMQQKLDLIRSDLTERGETAKESLSRNSRELKSDLSQKGRRAGIGAGFFVGAALVGLIALGVLAALLARVLDAVMPSWVALSLVLLLYGAGAAALAAAGRNRIQKAMPLVPRRSVERIKQDVRRVAAPGDRLEEAWPPVPEQTIETLKEDVEWAKHPTKSART